MDTKLDIAELRALRDNSSHPKHPWRIKGEFCCDEDAEYVNAILCAANALLDTAEERDDIAHLVGYDTIHPDAREFSLLQYIKERDGAAISEFNAVCEERDRLAAALEKIAEMDYFTFGVPVQIARAALKGE